MSKRVYISADYAEGDGDRNIVDVLNKWGTDNQHKVDFVDMSKVVSGSVASDPDCRACDLKKEFNSQINASSAVIFIVGDKTASRKAGSSCLRATKKQNECLCTPYKQNTHGIKTCYISSTTDPEEDGDCGYINNYSYLRHEFEQAKKRKKTIIVVYNSLIRQSTWLPSYLKDYESTAKAFWIKNTAGQLIGDYSYIKQALGYA